MLRPRLLLPAFALAAVLAGPAAAAPNPQIAGLQVALRAHGLYAGSIDAVAGPLTVRGVRRFQRRAKLVVDGVAGPRTRAALGPIGRPLFGKRMLSQGAVGWDVSVLQFLLGRRGCSPGTIDGRFAGATRRAVREFQRSAGLVPDGIVGPATVTALARGAHVPIAPGPALSRPTHVVRAGESLAVIAQRYRTTIGAIARANRLDPRRFLITGTRLRVPALAASPVAAAVLTPSSVRMTIDYWAGRYGVEPRLARALAWMESGYQPDLVSSVGAWGVMQVLPSTWRYVEDVLVGRRVARTTEGNVRVGILFLRQLLREFRGDERLALAAWYQGPGAVRARGLYRVTRAFVADVLALKSRV